MAVDERVRTQDLEQKLLPLPKDGEMSAAWRWMWTLGLWYCILGIGVALAMLGPTLQELTEQLRLPAAAAGTIFTCRAAGYLIGAVWCGDLLERLHNPALVFFVPLIPCCLGPLAMPYLTSYPLVCLLFASQGMSMGVLDTGGNVSMLALWRGSPYQNGFEHAFHFLFGLGAAIAPMVVRLLLERDVEPIFAWIVVGAAMAPACLWMAVLVFAPQPKTSHDEASPEGRDPATSKVVPLTAAFLFVYVGIEVAYGGYIDVFSVHWVGSSKVDGANLTALYWASLCAGRFVAAIVTPFVHHAKYLGLHLVLAIASIAVLGAMASDPSSVVPHTHSWWWGVLVPTCFFGFALAPLFPGALLVAEELLKGPLPTREAGIIVGSAAAGEMVLPMIVGVSFAFSPISFCWLQLTFCATAAAIFAANSASILGSAKA